jgi:hypothetical protein
MIQGKMVGYASLTPLLSHTYKPHPEETAKRSSRRMAAGEIGPLGSRRRFAAPHHEGLAPYSAAICRGAGGGLTRSAASCV